VVTRIIVERGRTSDIQLRLRVAGADTDPVAADIHIEQICIGVAFHAEAAIDVEFFSWGSGANANIAAGDKVDIPSRHLGFR